MFHPIVREALILFLSLGILSGLVSLYFIAQEAVRKFRKERLLRRERQQRIVPHA